MKAKILTFLISATIFLDSCKKETIQPCEARIEIYNNTKEVYTLTFETEKIVMFPDGSIPFVITTTKPTTQICLQPSTQKDSCITIKNINCQNTVLYLQ